MYRVLSTRLGNGLLPYSSGKYVQILLNTNVLFHNQSFRRIFIHDSLSCYRLQKQTLARLDVFNGLVLKRYVHKTDVLHEARVVKTPPFAESVSEGDIKWNKAVGDTVTEDDVVGEIETDKTSIPVPAPCSGVITELLVNDGDKVVAGQELYKIEVGAGSASGKASKPAASASPPPNSKPSTPAPPTSAPATSIPTSPPPAVAPSKLPPAAPTVPPGGIIGVIQPPPGGIQKRIKSDTASLPPPGVYRGEERVKMNRMRLRIASRLKEAQNTCAMLTTFNEVDMSNLIELRKTHKDAFLKKHGVKLGIMSAFAKASAIALIDQPSVNAVIDGTEIVYRDYVDISIAVATPKGLVVPVLRNVEEMNYADIERGIAELGEKARKGDLAIEDMDGGTFTISNGGVFGSLFGTPIINLPQSAILGLHGSFDRPVARNGQVVIRPMMYLALTYDHRLIDGREAVTFLRKIKQFVEDPRTYFLQM